MSQIKQFIRPALAVLVTGGAINMVTTGAAQAAPDNNSSPNTTTVSQNVAGDSTQISGGFLNNIGTLVGVAQGDTAAYRQAAQLAKKRGLNFSVGSSIGIPTGYGPQFLLGTGKLPVKGDVYLGYKRGEGIIRSNTVSLGYSPTRLGSSILSHTLIEVSAGESAIKVGEASTGFTTRSLEIGFHLGDRNPLTGLVIKAGVGQISRDEGGSMTIPTAHVEYRGFDRAAAKAAKGLVSGIKKIVGGIF